MPDHFPATTVATLTKTFVTLSSKSACTASVGHETSQDSTTCHSWIQRRVNLKLNWLLSQSSGWAVKLTWTLKQVHVSVCPKTANRLQETVKVNCD